MIEHQNSCVTCYNSFHVNDKYFLLFLKVHFGFIHFLSKLYLYEKNSDPVYSSRMNKILIRD